MDPAGCLEPTLWISLWSSRNLISQQFVFRPLLDIEGVEKTAPTSSRRKRGCISDGEAGLPATAEAEEADARQTREEDELRALQGTNPLQSTT